MFGEAEGRRRLGLIAVAQGKSRQPAFAEASAFAPGGFGGQDGGQPSRGWPAVAHATAGSRERRLVSREGIEPSTRRLRVHGGPSAEVPPCRFLREHARFEFVRVRGFRPRPTVRVSVRVSMPSGAQKPNARAPAAISASAFGNWCVHKPTGIVTAASIGEISYR
jgi:hypothetical protein